MEWPEPQRLPPTGAAADERGLRDTASGGWEQKLAPYFMMPFREKVGAPGTARDTASVWCHDEILAFIFVFNVDPWSHRRLLPGLHAGFKTPCCVGVFLLATVLTFFFRIVFLMKR